ncbi:MAG: hypothetical protein DKINENOH_01001 [bacterium]|nr:hypothetical protein [bacterium]
MNIEWINLLITPLVGAIIGFGVWFIQSRIEELRRAKETLHDERRKIYSEILEPYIRAFTGIKSQQEAQKAVQQVNSFDYKKCAFEFSLIGSDNVVLAFNKMVQFMFRAEAEGKASPDPKEVLHLWGAFLLEIRKSLGGQKTKLNEKDMLRGLIRDVDSVL